MAFSKQAILLAGALVVFGAQAEELDPKDYEYNEVNYFYDLIAQQVDGKKDKKTWKSIKHYCYARAGYERSVGHEQPVDPIECIYQYLKIINDINFLKLATLQALAARNEIFLNADCYSIDLVKMAQKIAHAESLDEVMKLTREAETSFLMFK